MNKEIEDIRKEVEESKESQDNAYELAIHTMEQITRARKQFDKFTGGQ